MAPITAREQVSMFCCGRRWVGVDRAHCCRRTAGCGHVFDDVALWDRHRRRRRCLDPRSLGLIPTIDGVWLRALELSSACAHPETIHLARSSMAALLAPSRASRE
jgi:hypothetical protein